MKIGVITTIFNEELILPFFLSHYAAWDDVLVLLDEATTDRSADVCKDFPNVTVENCKMTAGINDLEKLFILQQAFNRGVGHFDWIAVLDSDEFIIPFNKEQSAKEYLESSVGFDLVRSIMFPVYRNQEDKDFPAPGRVSVQPTFDGRGVDAQSAHRLGVGAALQGALRPDGGKAR